MGTRLQKTISRAKFAAMGAAVGAAAGGLISARAASTGAGIGALIGATIGEKRVDVSTYVDQVRTERKGTGKEA